MVVYIYTGWWFGNMEFYDFPYIGNIIIPTDELIFFRGVYICQPGMGTKDLKSVTVLVFTDLFVGKFIYI